MFDDPASLIFIWVSLFSPCTTGQLQQQGFQELPLRKRQVSFNPGRQPFTGSEFTSSQTGPVPPGERPISRADFVGFRQPTLNVGVQTYNAFNLGGGLGVRPADPFEYGGRFGANPGFGFGTGFGFNFGQPAGPTPTDLYPTLKENIEENVHDVDPAYLHYLVNPRYHQVLGIGQPVPPIQTQQFGEQQSDFAAENV